MRRARQPGYVLLVVLAVLAAAATALAAATRRAAEASARAGGAADRLRRAWAVRTLEAAAFARAEALLEADAEASGGPVHLCPVAVTLGGVRYDLVVADEAAKANVNRLAHDRGKAGLRTALKALAPAASRAPLTVRLRPGPEPAGRLLTGFPVRYATFAQCWADPGPEALLSLADPGTGAATALTVWGDGRVNVRRAPRAVLIQTTTGLLTAAQVDRLLALRRADPPPALAAMLRALELDRPRLARLRERLTDRSACHSVWTVARTAPRERVRLAVREGAGPGQTILEW